MEQSGIFINYQMAEAMDLIEKFDLTTSEGMAKAEHALIELKQQWQNDTLPGTDIKIGNAMVGMQDITVEEIAQLSQIAVQSEAYTVENAGAFQHIVITKEDGNFDFDFEKLDKIAALARKNGKKIIIDSAIVFGDHFPYKIANLDKETISMLIGEYTKKLTSRYGDIIERIDVFNAIFERNQISEGNNSEEFWIKTFGENYAQEIIDIVRANIDFNKHNIKLGWNEFYLTNSNYKKRKNVFLERIKSMHGLDVVGIQDRFMSGENIDYIIQVLDEISLVCKEANKEICITEFSCSASGRDLRNNTPSTIDAKIQSIISAVKKYCSTNGTIKRIEGRVSDKFDFNYKELKDYGFEISTTGRKQIISKSKAINAPQQPIQPEQSKKEEPFAQRSQSEIEIARQIQQKNQLIKQRKNKPKVKTLTQSSSNGTNSTGYVNVVVLSLVVSFVCGALFMIVYMLLGR